MKDQQAYFKHDSNASRDLKLMQIKAIYGYEGVGFFWSMLEVLREQNDYKWDEKHLEILAKILDADKTRFISFINDAKRVQLFKISSGKIYSPRLLKDMVILEERRNAGRSGGQAKRQQIVSKFLAKSKQTDSKEGTMLGKVRLSDVMLPSESEAEQHFESKGKTKTEATKFFLYYKKKGWRGIENWRAAADEWILRDITEPTKSTW